jgi:hypothetical protein
MDLEPMKNEESCYQSEDENDGIDRRWWVATCCPGANCTKPSWKKAHCWSYDSEDRVKTNIMNHLMGSSVHNEISKEMAMDLAMGANIEEHGKVVEVWVEDKAKNKTTTMKKAMKATEKKATMKKATEKKAMKATEKRL